MDYDQLIERFGGVVSTRQLLESGETTPDIRTRRRIRCDPPYSARMVPGSRRRP
ncbi:hypothetical protein [Gordonia sp. C13]|uniref:hypothetical protein n=1 Tax=Gordonia sp. C13 TaxID=2935078 RepID=UPI00200B313A|nr:hypothetical protein [Gordonia sp. C13]MCK8615246.1 hypothetical protein [Gordonia sp. C13]